MSMQVLGLRVLSTVALLAALGLFSLIVPSQAQFSGPHVAISEGVLNVRSGPATDAQVVDQYSPERGISVECKTRGEAMSGSQGSDDIWLRLEDGNWVTETFIAWVGGRPDVPWCAVAGGGATRAHVWAQGEPLSVRDEPSSNATEVRQISDQTELIVDCQAWGSRVSGPAGASHVWLRLAAGEYVTSSYVSWDNEPAWLSWCGQDSTNVPALTHTGFIEDNAPAAQESMEATGVPASVTLAQAILETGWGSGALGREDHNIFGMKCFDDNPGNFAIGCRDYATFECTPSGECVDADEPFRAYESAKDSFRDHGALLSGWSHYADAMAVADDADAFARAIHEAGYATDPEYSNKLIALMENYDLYQYDET
ncbi:sporangiospore maturation cell wall hydrolase GsmA [Natronoglycomyces albus]|uniref:Sporangiospore maturation cell wall hydrolase GsmA n=1 Tax=Natronoglycomyces albus TaxID=2811108 RepID=A0A895XWJ7_9ACTN|nr:sporangiospore maturation cell wall hydrolase GsmA [Natronoglycomyces albus]QSB06600.1 sporangiospore maturation cell wall hydrolase GsmA [Natronoglycomyces albus]